MRLVWLLVGALVLVFAMAIVLGANYGLTRGDLDWGGARAAPAVRATILSATAGQIVYYASSGNCTAYYTATAAAPGTIQFVPASCASQQ
jgi:hypothetical protein